MSLYINDIACCAVAEIADLGTEDDAEEAMRTVARAVFERGERDWEPMCAHLIFTEVVNHEGVRQTYGKDFAAFIAKHKLGTVTVGPAKINPNHRNPAHWVKVYTWAINAKNFLKWAKDAVPDFFERDERYYATNYPSWY